MDGMYAARSGRQRDARTEPDDFILLVYVPKVSVCVYGAS